MSLKAKIEAVIYASEEPVTLAQLVGLLGQEAQAELDRTDVAQGSLSLNETETDLEAEAEAESDPELADPTDRGGPYEAAQRDEVEEEADPTTPKQPGILTPSVTEGTLGEESKAPDTAGPWTELSPLPVTEGPTEPSSHPAALARAERTRLTRLRTHFRAVLDSLISDYATSDRGLEIREIAGGFRFATKPEYHDAVRGFVRSLKPPLKLTLQALETLAVVAYKQPVTAPEISEIRGVDSGGVLGSLLARKLITTAGRKQVIGRPILYKTAKDFLLKFGLKDLNELPSIEEFERMAGQMGQQEEMSIPMPDAADPRPDIDSKLEQTADKLEPERDVHSAQADGEPDGEAAPADNLEGAPEDKASIDGRLSAVPPNYADDDADNPSAEEAVIQSGSE